MVTLKEGHRYPPEVVDYVFHKVMGERIKYYNPSNQYGIMYFYSSLGDIKMFYLSDNSPSGDKLSISVTEPLPYLKRNQLPLW